MDLVEDEVVVVFGDPREIDPGVELGFEPFDPAGARVTRTDDDDLRTHSRHSGIPR